jgi:hypothetical protein
MWGCWGGVRGGGGLGQLRDFGAFAGENGVAEGEAGVAGDDGEIRACDGED